MAIYADFPYVCFVSNLSYDHIQIVLTIAEMTRDDDNTNEQNEPFFVDAGNVLEEQQAELSTDNYFAAIPKKKKTVIRNIV